MDPITDQPTAAVLSDPCTDGDATTIATCKAKKIIYTLDNAW